MRPFCLSPCARLGGRRRSRRPLGPLLTSHEPRNDDAARTASFRQHQLPLPSERASRSSAASARCSPAADLNPTVHQNPGTPRYEEKSTHGVNGTIPFCCPGCAQQKTVTGQVTSEQGTALSGVTVAYQGNQQRARRPTARAATPFARHERQTCLPTVSSAPRLKSDRSALPKRHQRPAPSSRNEPRRRRRHRARTNDRAARARNGAADRVGLRKSPNAAPELRERAPGPCRRRRRDEHVGRPGRFGGHHDPRRHLGER